MSFSDLKLYALNTSALAISMTNIELGLKVILLLVSIGYTITKWIELKKDNNG
jgi:hypothetical protein